MSLTLLLDLDDTLIDNSMDTFLPGYLQGLARRLSPYTDARRVAPELLDATAFMINNKRPDRTLEEVFDQAFYPALKIEKAGVAATLEQFYAKDFPELRKLISPRPEAVCLVEQALQRGYRVAIATAPLFPREAILERLRWAGLAAENYPFALVPDYSKFHFAKPNPAYFAEFLAQMGWPDGPIIMVGDDYTADIVGAQALGLPVFWIKNGQAKSEDGAKSIPQGELEDLLPWIDQQPAKNLKPDFRQPPALCAILQSTPAALSTLSQELDTNSLRQRRSPNEWSPLEIICHLRDVESEVNLPRLQQATKEENPFIAGRDTDPWTESRNYRQQDIHQVLADFSATRIELVNRLENLSTEDWQRSVRHAIFGPTTVLELVQFMTDHDRLHIQQFIQAKEN